MNLFNKTIVIGSLALASAAAMAQPIVSGGNYVSRVSHQTVTTQATGSKQASYELGLEQLKSIESLPGNELNSQFVLTNYDSNSRKTHIKEGSYVTVQERLNDVGQVEYVAQVHFNVHYLDRDSNR